jgi:hypothetical protein
MRFHVIFLYELLSSSYGEKEASPASSKGTETHL